MIGELLTVAFVVLKLCDVIDWGWTWVLAPMWMSLIAYVVIISAWITFFSRRRANSLTHKVRITK